MCNYFALSSIDRGAVSDFVCSDECQLPARAHARQPPGTWAYLSLSKQGHLLDIVWPIVLAPAHPRALKYAMPPRAVM